LLEATKHIRVRVSTIILMIIIINTDLLSEYFIDNVHYCVTSVVP